jgi:hypothetical protein
MWKVMGNSSSPLDLFTYANDLTSGTPISFGAMLLIATFFILFLAMKNYRTEQAFAVASFVTALEAILLNAIGIVPGAALPVAMALAIISAVMLVVM